MNELGSWENFYVIVGSSAGALIGLQFVVITLIAEMPVTRDVERASAAFATPTITHFSTVLLLSALLSMPWRGTFGAAVGWGILGAVGLAYTLVVARRMRTQTAYEPVFEDVLFHLLLPFAAYLVLLVSAVFAGAHFNGALFAVSGGALALLFIGIHNAWDTVTYFVFVRMKEEGKSKTRDPV